MWKTLRVALMGAFLLVFLTGCSQWGVVVPDGLAAPCPDPEVEVETWRDVAELARLRRDSLAECDERMAEIRALSD